MNLLLSFQKCLKVDMQDALVLQNAAFSAKKCFYWSLARRLYEHALIQRPNNLLIIRKLLDVIDRYIHF